MYQYIYNQSPVKLLNIKKYWKGKNITRFYNFLEELTVPNHKTNISNHNASYFISMNKDFCPHYPILIHTFGFSQFQTTSFQ